MVPHASVVFLIVKYRVLFSLLFSFECITEALPESGKQPSLSACIVIYADRVGGPIVTQVVLVLIFPLLKAPCYFPIIYHLT